MGAEEVVVVGAGGHALVVVDVLRSLGREIAGCVSSDGRARAAIGSLGVTMLGPIGALTERLEDAPVDVFVAIGDNRARAETSDRLRGAGAIILSAVSPSATLAPSVTVGPGALVMPGAVLNALVNVEAGVIVNTGASIDHECVLGAYAHVAPGAAIAGNVSVGEGALIGIGAAITPGCRIGAWCTVGAGAAVVSDVAPGSTVAGVPARELAAP